MKEEKVRYQLRIDEDTDKKIKAAMPNANCRSQNEFVENAILFYCDYLSTQDDFSVLSPALVSAIRGVIQNSESQICRMLFKVSYELDMVVNVLAEAMEISPARLRELREKCIKEVKQTNGQISLEKAMEH